MSLPRLTRQMTLETPSRSNDDAGGHVTTWTAQGTLFAEVKTGTGRLVSGEDAALSKGTFRIIIRAAAMGATSRPKPGDRLREGDATYRIDLVTAYDRGAHYLTCFVVAETVV